MSSADHPNARLLERLYASIAARDMRVAQEALAPSFVAHTAASVLASLRTHLMEPDLFEQFCEEFAREVNRLRMEHSAETIARTRERERIERELDKAIQAILDGVPGAQLKDKIGRLEDRKIELTALIAADAEPAPLLHPNMALIYRQRISELHSKLMDDDTRVEAVEVLRSLIDEIRLALEDGKLAIVLRGDLAAMLSHSADQQKPGSLFGDRAIAGIVGCGDPLYTQLAIGDGDRALEFGRR